MTDNLMTSEELKNLVAQKSWGRNTEELVFRHLRHYEEKGDWTTCTVLVQLVYHATNGGVASLRQENYESWRNICEKCNICPWKKLPREVEEHIQNAGMQNWKPEEWEALTRQYLNEEGEETFRAIGALIGVAQAQIRISESESLSEAQEDLLLRARAHMGNKDSYASVPV